jgi:HEAT repeat protein
MVWFWRKVEAIPDLLPLARDRDPRVRGAAVYALVWLDPAAHLSHHLSAFEDPDPAVRQAAVNAALFLRTGEVRDPRLAAPLIRQMKAGTPVSRASILTALGNLPGRESVAAL